MRRSPSNTPVFTTVTIQTPSTALMREATVIEDLTDKAVRTARAIGAPAVAACAVELRDRVIAELRSGCQDSYHAAIRLLSEAAILD